VAVWSAGVCLQPLDCWESRFWIPLRPWLFVSCVFCVLCRFVQRSHTVCVCVCLIVCDLVSSTTRRPWPNLGCSSTAKIRGPRDLTFVTCNHKTTETMWLILMNIFHDHRLQSWFKYDFLNHFSKLSIRTNQTPLIRVLIKRWLSRSGFKYCLESEVSSPWSQKPVTGAYSEPVQFSPRLWSISAPNATSVVAKHLQL
jgi:hypothetical protein